MFCKTVQMLGAPHEIFVTATSVDERLPKDLFGVSRYGVCRAALEHEGVPLANAKDVGSRRGTMALI